MDEGEQHIRRHHDYIVVYCFHILSFIEYFSKDDAERAIQELNGKRLGGKRVTVSGITVVRLI